MSLSVFLLLFVASRLLYLVLIDPTYLSPQLGDELHIGTIAQELVTGPTLPFTEYRANNFALGTLVIGALTAGFFELLGPTVFALKLAPLLVSTLTLIFWYWTIQRYAGERVAGYFAVLFCFSPPLLTAYSVAALGAHSESIVFSALTAFLLLRMLSDETSSPAVPTLLGLTAGVGLWFAYIYGLTLLALLGFWLWHDTGRLRRMRILWLALGFVVGSSPWILLNVQTHFAGLVIDGKNVWEHFGLDHLWEGLAHPRKLAPYEFFANIASSDPRDLPRRSVNVLYSILYLGPIMTAGVLHLKTWRSGPTGRRSTPTLVGFGILYIILFTLAVQFSDFRQDRYHVPAYPFLFFFAAHALAYCQDRFPRVQRQIKTVFLASVVVLGLGTHAPLLSLERPGTTLSAKGYAYAYLPWAYLDTHAPAGPRDREFILQQAQRPTFSIFLSDILSKLSSDDQQELARAIAVLLAESAPLNGQTEDFDRLERLVPAGFDKYFYYQVGVSAMGRYRNEVPKAVAAVNFLHHRSAAAHHLALVGIYRQWPKQAVLERTPESLVNAPGAVAPEVSPNYWRAIGHLAGRYWYDKDHSLSLLNTHLQVFVPRVDPAVQRSFLQGVGQALFTYPATDNWLAPAELERVPQAYQPSLLEGWGMALGDEELYSPLPRTGHESLLWLASTNGFSARSFVSIRQGKAQFEALFEEPASSELELPRQAL
ncbi:MAG: hypothetical protein E6K68_06035 [Nitrospirae bacterium]|nr:MAG: hypothetical protein E6K68_06035 [Nitrospirota bacterium]